MKKRLAEKIYKSINIDDFTPDNKYPITRYSKGQIDRAISKVMDILVRNVIKAAP